MYTGSQGGSLSSIGYDNLHRLTGYTWNSISHSFTYNAIGNVLTSTEGPSGTYSYGTKPHAVTSIGSRTYSYDACGNMTNRNGWALIYDEENQLKQINGTNTVTFGYADGGERLWKNSGGTLTIWIGGIYEIKGSKTLCHVFAGGTRVATFEPQTPLCAFIQTTPFLAACRTFFVTAGTWPLSGGRTPFTVTLIPLFGILCASVASRRKWRAIPLKRDRGRRRWCSGRRPGGVLRNCFLWELRHLIGATRVEAVSDSLGRRHARWYQWYLTYDPIAASPVRRFGVSLVSVVLIVALFFAVTPTNVEAGICDPVFWYYHSDHLTGSNVMTDRNGNYVDHYEYYTFGKEKYNDPTCSFNVSNRFTGQVLDEDTGLYYYGSRYYDPEICRFVQADSVVPSAGDPQTLNRYSYVRNNPLKYVDPSGHFFMLIAYLVMAAAGGAAWGAAVGAASAAVTGGDVGHAAKSGAITGAFQGVFGILGSIPGAAVAASVSGQNAGTAAAAAAIGAAVGVATFFLAPAMPVILQVAMSVFTGALAGGVTSVIQGGSFGQGMESGAVGAAINVALVLAASAAADYIAEQVQSDHGTPLGKEGVAGGETVGPRLTFEIPPEDPTPEGTSAHIILSYAEVTDSTGRFIGYHEPEWIGVWTRPEGSDFGIEGLDQKYIRADDQFVQFDNNPRLTVSTYLPRPGNVYYYTDARAGVTGMRYTGTVQRFDFHFSIHVQQINPAVYDSRITVDFTRP